jgi:carbon-monoxide dehydrogenase large subunit
VLTPSVLPKDEVCYAGELVVLVVAEDRYLAEDAAAAVEIEYVPLPAVADCLAALDRNAPRAHEGVASNVVARMCVESGDTDHEFRRAPHVFGERLHLHRGAACFMEGRGIVAEWNAATSMLTVHASTQSPHRLHRVLIGLMDCADSSVRVITPDVGGGFGPKSQAYPEYVAVCAAAQMLARPVKWIEDRREHLLATNQERDQYWDVEIAVDEAARIRGVRGRLVHDNGAYVPNGVVLPWISAATVPGPYVLPSYKMDVVVAMTNKISCSPVRGAGRPQAVVVMERLMDLVASKLGLDPAEVRLRNMIRPEQMPYAVGITFRDGRPVTYDSGDYPACQAKALARADYAGFAARQAAARKSGRHIGIGISNSVEATGLGPYEGATVRVLTNGRITVHVGGPSQGQGHKTTFAQIAAGHFGVGIDAVEVMSGDTAGIAHGHGTFGARMAVTAGSSVHVAAAEVARQVKALAAQMLEVPEAELELRGGRVEASELPSQPDLRRNMEGVGVSLRELAVRSIGQSGIAMRPGTKPGLESTAYFTPDRSTYANGTHVVEVEVDIETGEVKILRYVVVHDCGRVINPLIVNGQIVGGIAHGIGNALLERMVYDADAQPLSTNFGEYMLPLATDVPHLEISHMETPSPLNPIGVKGVGEGGTILAMAAVIGAVDNALAPLGVRIREAPISPQRIVELLNEAREKRAAAPSTARPVGSPAPVV